MGSCWDIQFLLVFNQTRLDSISQYLFCEHDPWRQGEGWQREERAQPATPPPGQPNMGRLVINRNKYVQIYPLPSSSQRKVSKVKKTPRIPKIIILVLVTFFCDGDVYEHLFLFSNFTQKIGGKPESSLTLAASLST